MTNDLSHLSKKAMGGIYGGKGYRFQDGYIAFKISEWMKIDDFDHIMSEALEDVEVVFKNEGVEYRYAYQIKDHQITPDELKELLSGFQIYEEKDNTLFKKYFIVCASLSDSLKTLSIQLEKVRNCLISNKNNPNVIIDTKKDFQKILTKIGIEDFMDLLLNKIEFEIINFDIDKLAKLFMATLSEITKYTKHTIIFYRVYFDVLIYLMKKNAKVVSKNDFENVIQNSIKLNEDKIILSGLELRIYHWETGGLEIDKFYDILIDWSDYFDRNAKKIPELKVLNEILLLELITIEKEYNKFGKSKIIRLFGPASLPVGFALGWTFPVVGHYGFELCQPPSKDIWKSLQPENINEKDFLITLNEGDKDSEILSVKLSIINKIDKYYEKYIPSTNEKYYAVLNIDKINKNLISNQDAANYAWFIVRKIKEYISENKINLIHLFYSGPVALAIFIGQYFNALPNIQLFEATIDDSYQKSFLLKKK